MFIAEQGGEPSSSFVYCLSLIPLAAHVITRVASAVVAGGVSLGAGQPATTREETVYTSFESQSLAPKYLGNIGDVGGKHQAGASLLNL
jgi:hypothetical protein